MLSVILTDDRGYTLVVGDPTQSFNQVAGVFISAPMPVVVTDANGYAPTIGFVSAPLVCKQVDAKGWNPSAVANSVDNPLRVFRGNGKAVAKCQWTALLGWRSIDSGLFIGTPTPIILV